MEMEVALLSPQKDFNFDSISTCSSPYISCPSSPQRIFTTTNFYFSAPTSPTRQTPSSLDLSDSVFSSPSTIPFNWEEKPGTPKRSISSDHQDFQFDFSGQLDPKISSLSADELFDKGKIKPLKPPPGYDSLPGGGGGNGSVASSPKSSPRSRKSTKVRDFDPFQAALEETRKTELKKQNDFRNKINQRGRERNPLSSSRKGTRSLSPLRVSDIMLEYSQQDENPDGVTSATSSQPKPSFLSAISFSSKKWRLKDLLLFRSASEGRPTVARRSKESPILNKHPAEDSKSSSFRSVTETSSIGGSSRRRGAAVSAHEMHYTANRAASEEMRRKTFLPYKQGLLGCLGFSNEISRGIGPLTRG